MWNLPSEDFTSHEILKIKFKVLPILKSVFLCLGEPGMPTEPIIYHQHEPGTLIWPSLLKVSQFCQWCEVACWSCMESQTQDRDYSKYSRIAACDMKNIDAHRNSSGL